MGIQDLGEQEALIARTELTIGDLKQMFGREATRRGLEYMRSLDGADKKFRDSIEPKKMEEGYKDAGVEGGEEEFEDITNKWAEKSEEKGIGIDNEN